MMTIDDEGEGGCLANDDVITEIQNFRQIFGILPEIFLKFSKKITKSGQKIFNFSKKFLLK